FGALTGQVANEEQVLPWPALGVADELVDELLVVAGVRQQGVAGGDEQCGIVDTREAVGEKGSVVGRGEVAATARAAAERDRVEDDVAVMWSRRRWRAELVERRHDRRVGLVPSDIEAAP